jgi:hypothetical protein
MFTDDERAFLARATRTLQIVVAALAGGVLSFLVVAIVINSGRAVQPPETPILTYMAIAAAPAAILVATLFPGVVFRSQRQAILDGRQSFPPSDSDSTAQLAAVAESIQTYFGGYQTALIIRSAILEGAAFFAVASYLLEGLWWSLVVAVVLLLFILAGLPTQSRAEDVVERERRAVEELRQMRAIDAR